MNTKFRFQDLLIWQEAVDIGICLFEIADTLEEKRLFRFTDQLRGVGMSISNNIAESTGTNFLGEQTQLLRYSRRECFEAASMILLLERKGLFEQDEYAPLLERLDILSRRIVKYMHSLK